MGVGVGVGLGIGLRVGLGVGVGWGGDHPFVGELGVGMPFGCFVMVQDCFDPFAQWGVLFVFMLEFTNYLIINRGFLLFE